MPPRPGAETRSRSAPGSILKSTGGSVLESGEAQPYDKLRRALRADTDEAARSNLYSMVIRLFATPESGEIAVKVMNHYGHEVLKVFVN